MSWKEKVFSNFKLYGVTDLTSDEESVFAKVEAAYLGGADIIQLRSKNLSDAALLRLGAKMKRIAVSCQKLFFVNDRPDLAILLEADGVHLGQDDLPVEAVRRLAANAGTRLWVGKSTHSLSQGLAAIQEGPDYLGVGPVFETPTKPNYVPAGLEYVRQASAQFKIPFVAIGGIHLENISAVLEAGARRIAVVRALFAAPDVKHAAEQLKNKIESSSYVQK